MRTPLPPLTLLLVACASAFCQDPAPQQLGLDEAIRLALERNGDVAASSLDRIGARARLLQARSGFFPTISPTYSYTDTESDTFGSPGDFSGVSFRQTQVDLSAEWLLLDSGQRLSGFRRAESSLHAAEFDERQFRRDIIFTVTTRYYEALRGQELLRVADAAVERATTVLEITRAQVEAGETAGKETLQAEADLANAEVQQIQAQLNMRVAESELKVTIGWPQADPLPSLVAPPAPSPSDLAPLTDYQDRAVEQRPDLAGTAERIRGLREAVRQAVMDSKINFQVTAGYTRRLELTQGFNRRLSFFASIPLFDAGRSREVIRESRVGQEAAEQRFVQQERQVRSEIESAYLTYSLRSRGLMAADKALNAARLNYEAATESRKAGAASLSEVINAELALVTAETNYVQAIYDFYIAESNLVYAVGDPLPGETP